MQYHITKRCYYRVPRYRLRTMRVHRECDLQVKCWQDAYEVSKGTLLLNEVLIQCLSNIRDVITHKPRPLCHKPRLYFARRL